MEHEPEIVQHKRQSLFWSVYTILNVLSLRLGRGSVVQDYDITIPSPLDSMRRAQPWGPVCALWNKQAAIQNQIYTLLYSPAALNRPERERVSHARRLAEEMHSGVIEPFNVRFPYIPHDPRLLTYSVIEYSCQWSWFLRDRSNICALG